MEGAGWTWLFSHSVMSDSLWPDGLQHARLPSPSPTPRVCSNSCPLSRWCNFICSLHQPYVRNRELTDVQAGFRKGRGARDQIANIHWIIEKAREFQKNIYFCFIDYAKAFNCVDHNKLWKTLQRDGNTRSPYMLLRILYAGQEATVRTGHGKQTGSKLGKEYVKAVYCHPAYLTYMQCTSCKMPDWMKHKMESRLPGEISITSDM